jgi:peptidoglycan/LPS O-acetylase OafA/YrhL
MRSQNITYSERLDHLRFFAVLAVISFHSFYPVYKGLTGITSLNPVHAGWFSVFVLEGHSAVGLFLTLSGFLFARICFNGQFKTKQFYLNRLLRIYPLYVSALVLSMCVLPAPVSAFFTSLLTFDTLPTALKGNYVDHLWSIGVEMQFYVIFPVLLLAYRKSGIKYLLQVIALTLLIIGCVQIAMGGTREAVYATFLGRLNQAVIGMILGFSFERFRKYASHPVILLAAVASMSFALQWLHECGGLPGTGNNALWVFWPSLEALLWGAVICSYQACSVRIPDAISKVIAYLGSMSYSLYVTHYFLACMFCASFANLLLAPPHHRSSFFVPLQNLLVKHPLETSLWAGTFLILPPTLLLSYFTFNVIERPFMGFRKKYIFPVEPVPIAEITHEEKELAYNH